MAAEPGVQNGCLLLADITGYTAFLTANELEHANGIIEDLCRSVVTSLRDPFRLVKLEGDAAFCYAPDRELGATEVVLEAIDRCYLAFGDRINDIIRQTSCTCTACANVSTLDLKFIAHYGQYIEHKALTGADTIDLAGPDVILVHRLLKNRVVEETGIGPYALLTDPLVSRISPKPRLREHSEMYESLGTVTGVVADLRPTAEAAREARRVYVGSDDADVVAQIRMPVPPSCAWSWWIQPDLSRRWLDFSPSSSEVHPNDAGRLGIGTENHCAHGRGRAIHRFVDWRPFEYFTHETEQMKWSPSTPPNSVVTIEFEPDGERGTIASFRVKLIAPTRTTRLMMPVIRRSALKRFRASEQRFRELAEAEGLVVASQSPSTFTSGPESASASEMSAGD